MSTLLLTSLCLTLFLIPQETNAARAFYVFGDSLVDSGNNNYLVTTARADSPPYGIDYPTGRPTGRFSNGLNLPDIISEQIGSEPTLPILHPELTGEKLLIGANFASAGIGILNDTGIQFINILRMHRQFELFQNYQERVSEIIGPDRTQQLVNGALVLMTLGGNDFVNNYFLPFSARGRQLSINDYSHLLVSEYKKILKRLYELGARRVMVTGTGPLGCVPAQLAQSGSANGECDPRAQQAAAIFTPLLGQMLQGLNREVGSDVFIAANAFNMNANFINNPQSFGFETSKEACCGQGAYNGRGVCTQLSNLCPDRNAYVFWDPFHPTERANRLIVQQLMTGSVEYMNPMNLSTIMALDSRI